MGQIKAADNKDNKQKPEYANWVSKRIPLTGGIITLVLAVCALFSYRAAGRAKWLSLVPAAFAAAAGCFAVYMTAARRSLSYEGGGIQGKVLDGVLSYLDTLLWDGKGRLLDIGCGSGAMSVKAAKKYSQAAVTGVDYWGAGWDYSKELCERNSRAEGMAERITFQKGDAAALEFEDGVFDAAVSNFVFHEVKTQPDKLALVREALRVVKPGGCFVFEDIFFKKELYGDIHAFVKALEHDAAEIHFADMRRPDYAPLFLNSSIILGNMGLIYGRK